MLNQKINQSELSENQFKDEKTGLTYEKVEIKLPVNVVDYYRAMAPFQNTNECSLIASDVLEKLEADFEGRLAPDWKQMFNLYPAFEKLAQP